MPPKEVRPFLERGPEEAERFGLGEFYRSVAEREGVSREEAAAHTRAVFAALRELLTRKERRHMAAQLPADYAPLLAAPA
jgi:uncharacterized protein (DUF2267 family)